MKPDHIISEHRLELKRSIFVERDIWVKKRFMSQSLTPSWLLSSRCSHWVAMKVGNAPWGQRRAADSFRSEPIGFMLRIENCLNAPSQPVVSRRPFHHHINGQLSISHAKSISSLFSLSQLGRRRFVLIRLSNRPYISAVSLRSHCVPCVRWEEKN